MPAHQDSPLTTITPGATGPVGASIEVSLATEGWLAGDVGKYILMSEGVLQITYINPDLRGASAKVLVELASVTPLPAG